VTESLGFGKICLSTLQFLGQSLMPLSFPDVKLGLFEFFNIEIKPDPIEQSSVRGADRFDAIQKPAIASFGVTHAKSHLTGAACA
jgi:hypothetical protein